MQVVQNTHDTTTGAIKTATENVNMYHLYDLKATRPTFGLLQSKKNQLKCFSCDVLTYPNSIIGQYKVVS